MPTFAGTAADDLQLAGAGYDTLYGDSGNDRLQSSFTNAEIYGGNGHDTLYINNGTGYGNLYGGDGNDWLYLFSDVDDVNDLYGDEGNDVLEQVGSGNTHMDGGSGTDSLHGGSGDDVLYGGEDNDINTVTITSGAPFAAFERTYKGGLYGGAGNDYLDGGRGNDWLTGGSGNDVVIGGEGNDYLLGYSGNDRLEGGFGDDYLYGGRNTDRLIGGDGNDKFDFNTVEEIGKNATFRDVIVDFVKGDDKIDLWTIDARDTPAGNNKFIFVAAEGAAFSGVEGELIWDQQDNSGTATDRTLVSGDTNGDGVKDFTIELTGLHNLSSTDFVL